MQGAGRRKGKGTPVQELRDLRRLAAPRLPDDHHRLGVFHLTQEGMPRLHDGQLFPLRLDLLGAADRDKVLLARLGAAHLALARGRLGKHGGLDAPPFSVAARGTRAGRHGCGAVASGRSNVGEVHVVMGWLGVLDSVPRGTRAVAFLQDCAVHNVVRYGS